MFGRRIALHVTRRSRDARVGCLCCIDPAVRASCFRSKQFVPSGWIRGDVFTKGINGEPAVLPGVLIVLHGPITKETESDAKGAFAVDGLPPGAYRIEANAPGLYGALAVEVSPGT